MGKPAARLTDMHVCPMFNGPVPHVGGPIIGPGSPTVLIGGMPAAVMGDMCVCTGPPDTIILGSTGVMIGGKPAARMGDQCAHGGTIILGCMTVLIGETMPSVTIIPPSVGAMMMSAAANMTPEVGMKAMEIAAFKDAAATGAPYPVPQKIQKEEKPPPKQIEKDSLAFSLKDEDGNPVSDVKYEVTLPNGSVKKGTTDKEGKVKLNGIDPGTCKISFPDLDEEEWG